MIYLFTICSRLQCLRRLADVRRDWPSASSPNFPADQGGLQLRQVEERDRRSDGQSRKGTPQTGGGSQEWNTNVYIADPGFNKQRCNLIPNY